MAGPGDLVLLPAGAAAEFGMVTAVEGGGRLTVELLRPLDETSEEDGTASGPGWTRAEETGEEVAFEAGDLRVVEGWSYEERLVQDRVSNPHGEHAEAFFDIPPPPT